MVKVYEYIGKPHQVPIVATLWGGSKAVVGHHIPTDTLITTMSTYSTGASGYWELDLFPNSEIEPAGTTWRIMRDDICSDNREDYITFISVPASGGPFLAWDLQVAGPGTVQDSALFVHASSPSHLSSAIQAPAGGWGPIPWEQAQSRLMRGVVFGDSVPLGQFSSNWLSKGYISVARNLLQAALGDGGSGYQNPVAGSTVEVGGGYVSFTGAWTTADEAGVTRQSIKPTVLGNGAIATFTARGTSVDIWFKTNTGWGPWHYQIDGGSFVSVTLNVAPSILKVTINGLAPGNHTVAVRATTGDGRLYGVGGRNATGVVVHNASIGGTLITALSDDVPLTSNADSYLDTEAYHTFNQLGPVDFAILALGINDILLDTDITTFVENVWNALSAFRVAMETSGVQAGYIPPVILVAQHVGKSDVLTGFSQYERDWLQMHSMLRAAASSMGALFLDYWALGRRSWQYWRDLGYWYFDGATFNDVHPGDAGHAYMGQILYNALRLAVV